MRLRVFFAFLILFSCSAEKKMNKAFRFGEYQRVIDYYQSTINKNPKKDQGKANYYIAESYRLSNRIREAEPYYEKAKSFSEKSDSVSLFYALSLKANGKYAEAKQELEEIEGKVENEKMAAHVQKELDMLVYLDSLDQKKNYYKIKNMETLNTSLSEYSAVYLNDELYFTASRKGGKTYIATGTPFSKIYKVKTKGANVEVKTLTPLSEKINSPYTNQGCVAFSPNGRIMVFAKGNTGKRKGSPDVDLYISFFRKGKWTTARRANINIPDAWESTPAFSENGRTLYFSSNRKGGYGGLDLYSAQISARGRLIRAKNLGPSINTPGDELFPFVSKEGKFFFASDGHSGYGMLDLFEVNRKDGKNKIENMGRPINSPGDDFGIFLFEPNKGFFTSNRKEGKGDDDLYTFVNNDPNLKIVNYYLAGVTMTPGEDDKPLEIVPNTEVTLLDAQGEILQNYTTGSDGKFSFQVYENENYTLVGEADGYLVKRQTYTTYGKSVPRISLEELVTNITLDTVLVLDKLVKDKTFVVENIYFDFSKSDIRPDAARELNKVAQMLRDNPEIKIEMGSHTDSVDTREYNIELSQKRAESTVNYLVSRGISRKRLVAKGYGEEQPIARNTNPDGSDNPEGRQRNRRTEFKILEIGARKKNNDPISGSDEDKYFDN